MWCINTSKVGGEPLYKLLLHGTENEGKLDAMKRLLQNNILRKGEWRGILVSGK